MLFFFLVVFTTYHRTLYFVVYLEVIFLSSHNPTSLYRTNMFIDGVLYFFFLGTRTRERERGHQEEEGRSKTKRQEKEKESSQRQRNIVWSTSGRGLTA